MMDNKVMQPKNKFFVEFHRLKSATAAELKDQNAYVEGYITTTQIDSAGEVVAGEAIDGVIDQVKSGNYKLDIEHNNVVGEPDIAIGKIIEIKKVVEDGITKAWVKAELNKAHSKFTEVWESIKNGFIDGFSIAYKIKEEAREIVNGVAVNMLKSIELLNVALTGMPANKGSIMQAAYMKSMLKGQQGTIRRFNDPQIKAMEKDGGHAHTENDPLGEHNHPELTAYIKSMEDYVYSELSNLRSRIYDLQNPNSEVITASAKVDTTKDGGIKVDETQKADPVGSAAAPDAVKNTAQANTPEIKTQQPDNSEEVKSLAKEVEGLKSLIQKQAAEIEKLKSEPQLKSMLQQPAQTMQKAPEQSVLQMIR